ncbi:MAG: BatD family protein [Xanthomonadales bacterium]|nr:BatD family protein [Xanthomonadales bacterium]
MLLLFAALSAPVWAAVELQLDRDRVMVGETVTLTFVTDNPRQNLETDFSVLEGDFEILDRRSETRVSIVNGRQTSLVRLLLTVEPRHDGDIQVPAFQFGKESTAPVMLRVDPAPDLEPGALPPVFIEVELNPGEGPYYVHAQFGLVVRVFYQQNLTEAAISQPEPDPASVRLLQETPYQAERGGERYRVLERHYAIFPERSGELIIPAMELSGRLVEPRSSSMWQPTVRGRRVRAQSDELRLLVEPRPAAFTGTHWQPARELKISQQISSADALRVGEPVTRTVLIDAVGLEENMLAEPFWPELEGARIYPDQPQGITRDDGRWVLGHKEFRYAVVPEKEGKLVLPELQVDWWDTRSNRQRSAVLPAHTLLVQPSQLVPPAAEASPVPANGMPQTVSGHSPAGPRASFWKWAALLLTVLWLLTIPLAWRWGARSRPEQAKPGQPGAVDENEAALLRSLKRACDSSDQAATRRALQRWLRDYGPAGETSVLEFAAATGDEALRNSLYGLDSVGYRRDRDGVWNGKTLWAEFEAWRRQRAGRKAVNKPPLTDLYARENRVG